MMLKQLLGLQDGVLNLSSKKFAIFLSLLRWTPKITTAEFHLINFAIVEYGDPDVWYAIARYNDLREGIAPANSTILIPTAQSVASALSLLREDSATSELGTTVMI